VKDAKEERIKSLVNDLIIAHPLLRSPLLLKDNLIGYFSIYYFLLF
jgi:hypothetical protein